MSNYEAVIGLEIHVQLKTRSKMFCSCENLGGGGEPNTTVCPVCMGHPGTLPVLNQEAIKKGLKLSLALHCEISNDTRFDRKHYFYPDLPKGYQISQYDRPIGVGGYLTLLVDGIEKKFELERLHLEEDAGKIFHRGKESLVDFNRTGVPLAEIVTKPVFRSAAEARQFLQELRLIARYLGVSDADMEKGQLRCDANISLRKPGEKKLNAKTEVKNLNSFKAVEKALLYEMQRQGKLHDTGKPPQQNETHGWDENKLITVVQRGKEESHDYRYFPEPDLPRLVIDDTEIAAARAALPELPAAKRRRFITEFELRSEDVDILATDKDIANYFEAVVSELKNWLEAVNKDMKDVWSQNKKKIIKLAHSWITRELFKYLKTESDAVSDIKITPENFSEFISLVYEAKVNSTSAQTIFDKMYHEGRDPSDIAEDENLFQTADTDTIREFARLVIKENPKQAQQFTDGKEVVLQYLVGQIMKKSHGTASPQVASDILREELKN